MTSSSVRNLLGWREHLAHLARGGVTVPLATALAAERAIQHIARAEELLRRVAPPTDEVEAFLSGGRP